MHKDDLKGGCFIPDTFLCKNNLQSSTQVA